MRRLKRLVLSWLGSGRKRDFNSAHVHRILVFRYDRIGDMVVTTPFLRALHKGLPHAAIDVLCSTLNAPVVAEFPGVSGRPIYSPGLTGLLWLWTRRGTYDLVVDLNHSVIWHDLLAIRLLRPRYAATVFKDGRYGLTGGQLSLYTFMAPRHPLGMQRPISEVYLDLAAGLTGRPTTDLARDYVLTVSAQDAETARRRLGVSPGQLLIGINQHGGRPQMRLRNEDMQAICNAIVQARPEAVVVWLTSPATVTQVSTMAAGFLQPGLRVWQPNESIRDVFGLLSQLSMLVTPDTSLVHIAAAFQVPLVAVYANEPELIVQWAPPTARMRLVRSQHAKSLEGYDQLELLEAVRESLLEIVE